MVYFITGNMNSGKSANLLSLYEKKKIGDGFYNRKVFEESEYIGQEIVWLSTKLSCPFSRHVDHIPQNWNEIYRFGDFSFSKNGFLFAESIIDSILKDSKPAYIDELGPLELRGLGLFKSFSELLKTGKDIYAVVRNRSFSDIIEKFKIEDYRVL